MAYYRVITPAGHLAPGTVVTDEQDGDGQSALFSVLPQTARALCQSGALAPIPDPVPSQTLTQEPEPGWASKDTPAAQQRPSKSRRGKD